MKKIKPAALAVYILTVVWIAFIWINSMQVGSASGEMSGSVTEQINAFLALFANGAALPHLFIRKAAHFLEFALLAVLLCADILLLLRLGERDTVRGILPLWIALPCAMAVAAADEIIQLFVEGRVGSFADVLIDSSGALCATLIFFGVMLIKLKIKGQRTYG